MLMWFRWGFFAIVALGLGTASGFALQAVLAPNVGTTGPATNIFAGIGLILAGGYTWLLCHLLIGPRLDKPRPLTVWQPLPQPIVNQHGARQTHQLIPVTHPATGEPLYSHPRSTLFFIPVRFWPFIFAGIGVVLFLVSFVALLLRP